MYRRAGAPVFTCVPIYKDTGADFFHVPIYSARVRTFFLIYTYTGVHIIRVQKSLLRVKDPEEAFFAYFNPRMKMTSARI